MEKEAKTAQPDIEDVLKNFVQRVSNILPSDSINPKDQSIREQIPELSQEFAGIVFALNQIISGGIMTQKQGVNLIRQFYEYDTGKQLRVSFLEGIVKHEKVKAYEARIMPNIMKRFTKEECINRAVKQSQETDNEKNGPIDIIDPSVLVDKIALTSSNESSPTFANDLPDLVSE